MVLHPLEFSECYSDSPWFRQSIQEYEEALDRTNSQIKLLIKDAKSMIHASRDQGKRMFNFSERLTSFHFDLIGENLTDYERGIAGSLKEFGMMMGEFAQEWKSTIDRTEIQIVKPLESFRKDHILGYREQKKLFDKSSERYYKQLEHTLGLSHKKKEQQLTDSDNELFALKRAFHKEALRYVYKLQEVQERKKFEFVEFFVVLMQNYFNYFHQSHETARDYSDYLKDIQVRLVATREQFTETHDKTQTLMRRMEAEPDDGGQSSSIISKRWSRSGYLYLERARETNQKNPISARLTSKWSKYFCTYNKENKLFQLVTPHTNNATTSLAQQMQGKNSAQSGGGGGGGGGSSSSIFMDSLIVLECTRRSAVSSDKRFCFDLEVEDTGTGKQQLITCQAISEADRKKWLRVMDGKEPPEYEQLKDFKKEENRFKLDSTGFQFVERVIREIERRGVSHEGIYRLVGVVSKVEQLLNLALNSSTADSVVYTNENEWDMNTLTSALKNCFRNLPEPLMTFDLHRDFISAAKLENPNERVTAVAELVKKLPPANQKVLAMLSRHLQRVEASCDVNKMTLQNLGVCFGPTLMRERQESVQSILEIKFSNIIAEIVIEEFAALFGCDGDDDQQQQHKPSDAAAPVKMRTATVTRLPSERLRSRRARPTPTVYELQSLPNILESREQQQCESRDHRDDDYDEKKAFRRSHAFRAQVKTVRSPAVVVGKGTTRRDSYDSSHSTGDDDDDLELRPMDLDLGSLIPDLESRSAASPESDARKPAEWPRRRPIPDDIEHAGAVSPESDARKPAEWPRQRSIPRASKWNSQRAAVARNNKLPTDDDDGGNNANRNSNNAVATSNGVKLRRNVRKHGRPLASFLHRNRFISADVELPAGGGAGGNGDNKTMTSAVTQSMRNPKVRSVVIPSAFQHHPLPEAVMMSQRPEVTSHVVRRNATQQAHNFRPRTSPVMTQRADVTPTSPDAPPVAAGHVTASPTNHVTRSAMTKFACVGESEEELSFEAGQLLTDVRASDEPGWLSATLNGREGVVPENYVSFV